MLAEGADYLSFGQLLAKIASHWASRGYALVFKAKHGGKHLQFGHIHALTVTPRPDCFNHRKTPLPSASVAMGWKGGAYTQISRSPG